jgi:hypothetical protein
MIKNCLSAICGIVLGSWVIFTGCSKTVYLQAHTPVSYYSTDVTEAPYYGDTILHVVGTAHENYLFTPTKSLGSGHYVSWPEGLAIDSRTGTIDASASEPGARYNVGFVSDRTKDTVYSQVVLAGLSYQNGVYVRGGADSVLAPYYNADLSTMGKGSASFYTGSEDGSINLNTLAAMRPASGTVRQIQVNYRMNDGVSQGVQTTTLTVYYYDSYADVPAALKEQVGVLTTGAGQTMRTMGTTPAPPVTTAPKGPSEVTVDGTKPAATPAPTTPRPPQIVIVNKGH